MLKSDEEWKKISNNRLMKEHEDGFLVIKPEDHDKPIPFFCPVCSKNMRNIDDANCFRDYECCFECSLTISKK